jgi:hypothetical protein
LSAVQADYIVKRVDVMMGIDYPLLRGSRQFSNMKTVVFGEVDYTYSGSTHKAKPFPKWLTALMKKFGDGF